MNHMAVIKQKIIELTHRTPPKTNIHFLHIGKTGGTAIIHALNEYHYCAPSPRRAQMGKPDIYKLNPAAENNHLTIYVHPHDEGLRDVPEGEKVFFFLRDPVSRFLSGFYSRQRQGKPRYNAPWSPGEKTAYERFNTGNELALALSSINKDEKTAAEKAMRSIQHVRDSYWKWFENEAYFKSRLTDIFFVGFQESLAQDFEILKATLNLSNNVSLPADDILAHRNPANLNKKLDDEAIENLKIWYKNDDQFIDLCKEIFRPELAKS